MIMLLVCILLSLWLLLLLHRCMVAVNFACLGVATGMVRSRTLFVVIRIYRCYSDY